MSDDNDVTVPNGQGGDFEGTIVVREQFENHDFMRVIGILYIITILIIFNTFKIYMLEKLGF